MRLEHPRRGRFGETEEREPKKCGVEPTAAEHVRVRAEVRVPSVAFDLLGDEPAVLHEALDREVAELAAGMHREEPIERDPAEMTRVRVVAELVARFPDPVVGVTPVAADVLAEPAEHALGLAVEDAIAPDETSDGVDRLAVNVDLHLARGRVADPNRARARVSAPLGKNLLAGPRLSPDIVEDSELRTREPSRVEQPTDECLRILDVAEAEERPSREGSVAEPTIAVVVVEIAAESFGKRRCRRGDDRPRGSVRQKLQCERAAHHGATVRAIVAGARRPAAPPAERRFALPLDELPERRHDRGRLAGEGQREGESLPGSEARLGAQTAGRVHREADVAAQRDQSRTDFEPDSERAAVDEGRYAAVIGPRIEIHDERDLAPRAIDDANELMLGMEGLPLLVFARGGQEVRDDRHARRGMESGFEDVRVLDVTPLDLPGRERRDAPRTAGLEIEQPPEQRRAVELRPTKPVDRARTRDERRCPPISNGGVILDLARARLPPPRVDTQGTQVFAGARKYSASSSLTTLRYCSSKSRPTFVRKAFRSGSFSAARVTRAKCRS